MVGDATDQTDVFLLAGLGAADLIFTDPPYNVDYEGYTADALKIKGDRMSGTFDVQPTDGDCASKPVTKFHVKGKGTLT